MKYPNIVGSTHLLKAIWTLFGLSKEFTLGWSSLSVIERRVSDPYLQSLATLIATATPAFAKTITGIDIAKSTVCVEKNPDKVVNGGGRIIYSSALLDSETPINRIVARCNDRIGSDPHTYQKYLAVFSKISNLLNYGKHYSEKWKIDAVIAEETDLILVGLENLLRAQKSGVL